MLDRFNRTGTMRDTVAGGDDLDKVIEETVLLEQKDPAGGGAISGHLDGVDDEGRLMFKPEGSAASLPVAIGLSLSDDELAYAARMGRRALVVRTCDVRPRYILISLLRERIGPNARASAPGDLKAQLDGDNLLLKAREKIELICGKTRILLHKDGRIEMNGNYLVSKSRGPIKIKGASIEMN